MRTAVGINHAEIVAARLIHDGHRMVADRQERLVSAGALPRTFTGYSTQDGRPRFLVLATASAMSFDNCARLLKEYFARHHRAACEEAMAFDGGASTQMACRIERLHDELGVVRIRRICPTRAFDVDLAMRINRVIAPGEQTQHHVRIQIIHARR